MQTMYLSADEVETYCEQIPVTESQVAFASSLIDAFVGNHDGSSLFTKKEQTDVIKLNRKGIGRLKHKPVIEILKVSSVGQGMFGFTEVELDINTIQFDEEGYIYTNGFNNRITRNNLRPSPISQLKVQYTYGFEEIPEPVKRACAMLAMNISQTATFTNLQSMTTLDARFSLANPSLFTTDIKSLLTRYRK